jgi:hypothetical protein
MDPPSKGSPVVHQTVQGSLVGKRETQYEDIDSIPTDRDEQKVGTIKVAQRSTIKRKIATF